MSMIPMEHDVKKLTIRDYTLGLVADGGAIGGFYRASNIANDAALYGTPIAVDAIDSSGYICVASIFINNNDWYIGVSGNHGGNLQSCKVKYYKDIE